MKMVPLGEVIRFAGKPEHIRQPANETFVTVKLNCAGAVERNIRDGKTPVPFTGYRVTTGQFIYSRIDARNGAFAIVPPALDGAVVSKDFPVFDIQPEIVDAGYLMHFLQSGRLQRDIQSMSLGATNRQRIAEERLLSFTLPLPLLDEQRRIAAILDRADMLRAKRRKASTESSRLGQSLFVEMFGHPAHNPRGYPSVPLGEVGSLDRGVSKHRPRNDPSLLEGAYPLIQTGDVARSDGYITTYSSTYSELGLAQSKLWPIGTLCITIAANIAQSGILTFPACFPDSVVGFTADEPTAVFVRTWLTFLQATLEASAPQSAQRNINLAILRRLPVPLPDSTDRHKFSTTLHEISVLANIGDHSARSLDSLFASLQSRAFRGEL